MMQSKGHATQDAHRLVQECKPHRSGRTKLHRTIARSTADQAQDRPELLLAAQGAARRTHVPTVRDIMESVELPDSTSKPLFLVSRWC